MPKIGFQTLFIGAIALVIGWTDFSGAAKAQIEEIVVTATRREQSLQDVPIAVSVFSGEILENSGVDDIQELMNLSPSFQASTNVSETQGLVIRIRGIGTQGNNPAFESAVGIFIDGVYRARAGIALAEMLDIERIEVLRGPQGTLFGRNTSAGALNIITRAPTFERETNFQASYGNIDEFEAKGSFSGPIVEDKLAARLSMYFLRRDGFITDLITGEDLDTKKRYTIKGQLLFTPTENIDYRLIFDFREANENCCFPVTLNTDRDIRPSDIINGVLNTGSFINPFNPAPKLGTQVQPPDPFARLATANDPTTQNVKDFGFSGELNIDFGAFKLTSITSYRQFTSFRQLDVDFTDADLIFNERRDVNEIFTHEVRLQGVWNKLDWLVGGFFSDENLTLDASLTQGADYEDFINARLGNLVLAYFLDVGPLSFLSNPASQFSLADLAASGFRPYSALAAVNGVAPGTGWFDGSGAQGDTFRSDNRSFSIFTHNVFNVTEDLQFIAGFRMNFDDKTAKSKLNNNPANTPGCTAILPALKTLPNVTMNDFGIAPGDLRLVKEVLGALGCLGIASPAFDIVNLQQDDNEWNGIVGLSYRINQDVMTYFHLSRGYKAGGINLDRAGTILSLVGDNSNPLNFLDPRFEPELVDAIEGGIKTSWLGNRLQINIAGFYNDIKNFQLNTFTGFNFTPENVAKVTTTGFEVDFRAVPTDGLTIQGGVAYAKADYGNNITDETNILANERGLRDLPAAFAAFGLSTTLLPEISPLAGKQLTNAPRWVFTGAVSYSTPLPMAPEYEVFGHIDFRWSSSFNTGSDLDPEKLQESFAIFNLRAGLRMFEGAWQIEGWARNVFDKDYHQVAFDIPLQANASFGSFLADPRTYGFTTRVRF